MQTILGANGINAHLLSKELKLNYTSDIRLVSRNPAKVNDTDQIFSADLMDKSKTDEAVRVSETPKFVNKKLNASIVNKRMSEMTELLPRYEHHNIFDSSKF